MAVAEPGPEGSAINIDVLRDGRPIRLAAFRTTRAQMVPSRKGADEEDDASPGRVPQIGPSPPPQR